MSQNELQGRLPTSGAKPSSCPSGACPLRSRWGLVLWALLIGGVLYMQWPMLKGSYYKAVASKAPPSAVAWRSDFEAALAESAKTGKPVLADFSATWCPPCQVMKHDVWPDDKVAAAANASYVPLLLDVDNPASAEVAEKYGIQSIPTVLVIDAKGTVLRRGTYMSVSGMLDFLKPKT